MDEDTNAMPDLRDIETKLGRKVPDSLIRSLAGGKHHDRHEKSAAPHQLLDCKFCANSADLKRLESKMLFLKQEMVGSFSLSASCLNGRGVKGLSQKWCLFLNCHK